MINIYIKSVKIFTLLISILYFLGCGNSNEKEFVEIDNQQQKCIDEIRKELFKEKRISTLKHLWYRYDELDQKSLILSDAFLMANTNDDPLACHLIFEGYLYLHFPEIENIENINKGEYFYKLPKKEQEIVINYLEKGADKKFFKCINDLIEIHEYKNSPKANYYKSIKDLKYIQDFY